VNWTGSPDGRLREVNVTASESRWTPAPAASVTLALLRPASIRSRRPFMKSKSVTKTLYRPRPSACKQVRSGRRVGRQLTCRFIKAY
jgi:hypothetical protein